MADEFGNLEEDMGEDFGFGFEESEGDPNVKPVLKCPDESVDDRTYESVTFTWEAVGQLVTVLNIQAMPVDKVTKGFDESYSSRNGGVSAKIKDAANATTGTIKGLKPFSDYVFRLVARNVAGDTYGPVTSKIKTLSFDPPRGDKSGWVYKLPDKKSMSGTLRRMSLKMKKPDHLFMVLDGALLTFYKEPDADELMYIHMAKVSKISWPKLEDESENNRITIVVKDTIKDKVKELTYDIDFRSEKSTITDNELFCQWRDTLLNVRKNVGGLKHVPAPYVMESKKK